VFFKLGASEEDLGDNLGDNNLTEYNNDDVFESLLGMLEKIYNLYCYIYIYHT
jgi:hypothetical protein